MTKKKRPEKQSGSVPSASPPGSYREFKQVYGEIRRMRGTQTYVKDLVASGAEFLVRSYEKRHSQWDSKPYGAVQIELPDGEFQYFNSSAAALLDQLDRIKGAGGFPFRARLVSKKSGSGRSYISLA